MNRIKGVLSGNRGGVNQFVATVVCMLAILMLFLALTAGMKAYNQYSTLNDFANQLVYTASNTGRCSGADIDRRYAELSAATGLSPQYEFSGTWFNSDDKTVQYGSTITLQLTLPTSLSAIGINIPITLQIEKTAESQHYWK
jgi:hypothetical protein